MDAAATPRLTLRCCMASVGSTMGFDLRAVPFVLSCSSLYFCCVCVGCMIWYDIVLVVDSFVDSLLFMRLFVLCCSVTVKFTMLCFAFLLFHFLSEGGVFI